MMTLRARSNATASGTDEKDDSGEYQDKERNFVVPPKTQKRSIRVCRDECGGTGPSNMLR
jgi:hypothetical protein